MHRVLLGLLLGGCIETTPDSPVTMAPTLSCQVAVRCQGYRWHAGISKQAFLWLEGNHLRCQCEGFMAEGH